MSREPLSSPISVFMRPSFILPPGASLGSAANKLRENSAAILPISDGRELQGIITERSLALALARGADLNDAAETALESEFLEISMLETGAEALRRLELDSVGALVVVDSDRRVAGVIRASDLIDPPRESLRPGPVGGMATPFGVYLTSGEVRAGVSNFALMTTGALMFVILTLASMATDWFAGLLASRHVPDSGIQFLASNLLLLLFSVTFRLLPISGIHAAEHMVVHAIERGEPLVPAVVKRMPRVHPRCGTNLAVGSTFFLSIAMNSMIQPEEFRLLLALVLTVLLWKPLGAIVQYWITTKPPTDKQIQMGIRSGKELLAKQREADRLHVAFPTRLWNSGIFYVIAGSMTTMAVLVLLKTLFPGLPLPAVE